MKKYIESMIDYLGVNKSFLFFWLFCLGLVVLMQSNITDSNTFIGLVSSRPQEVSTSSSAKVLKIHVFLGKVVKKGELLLELKQDDLDLKLSGLKSELKLLMNEKKIVDGLSRDSKVSDPEIKSLREQLIILERAKKDLFIFSDFDGKVASINYKEGEIVSPYSSIITLQEEKSTTVLGYIHESQFSEVSLNQKVIISSLNGVKNKSNGQIVGIGSRLVTFPVRLLKDPDRPVWGREVIIQLDKANTFLLGEKVFIDHKQSISFSDVSVFGSASAHEGKNIQDEIAFDQSESKMKERKIVILKEKFEASGIVYLDDIKKYLVINDKNAKEEGVKILFVSEDGSISYDSEIAYLEDMDDLESVTIDQKGNIYFLSSLNKSKKKNDLLILKRNGFDFSFIQRISLFSKIEKAILTSADLNINGLLLKNEKLKLDVEGMIVKDNDLFLGLRAPITKSGETVILKVDDLNSLIDSGKLASDKISIWKKIRLENYGRSLSISGLAFCSDHIYIAAAPSKKKGRYGALYKINHDKDDSYIEKMLDFSKDKPEGIFMDSKRGELAISFDNGKSPSKVIFYDL